MTPDDSQKNTKAQAQGRESNDHPNSADAEIAPRAAKLELPVSDAKCCESPKTKKHWLDYATFVVEILGLIGLAIYAILTYGIWCANKKAAEAAKDAADAATGANKISRDALETVQRAYMVFDEINGGKVGTLIPIGTNIWQFTPMWENAGNTPATPAIQDNFARLLNDEPNEKQFIGTEKEYPTFQVGPHAHVGGVARSIQESSLLEARVGAPNTKKFIAWGWMVYKDVLPKTEPHVTEFCVQLKLIGYQMLIELDKSGVPKVLPNAPARLNWQGCKTHNCVDKQCKDYEQLVALLPQ